MNVAFRPATPAGIDIALGFMSQLYSRAGFDEVRARKAFEDLLAQPEFGGLWFIDADGHAAGYIVLSICYSLEFHGRFVLLDELFVDAGWRGRGLGSQALAFAGEFSRVRGFRAIRLEVAWQNPRARELYNRSGFQLDDRDLMTKWVAPRLLYGLP
jgi:GNAT superfamily N-acetyltransferase